MDLHNRKGAPPADTAKVALLDKGSCPLEAADVPLLLATLFIPLLPTLMGGVPLKAIALQVFAVLALLMLPLGKGGFNWRRRTSGNSLDPWILLWLLVAAAGIMTAHLPVYAIHKFGHVLALALLYYVLTTRIRSFSKARIYFMAAALSAVGVSLVEYFNYRATGSISSSQSLAGRPSESVLFIHSYLAAQFLLPVLIMVLSFVVNQGPRRGRILAALAATPILVYLFIIGSRGAYLTFLAAMVFVLVLAALRFRPRQSILTLSRAIWFSLPIVFMVVVLIFILSSTGVLGDAGRKAIHRVESLFNPEMAEFNFSRIQVWMDALNMSLDSLLLGTGQGHFSLVFPAYHQEMKPISHAHNQFVQILCENGVAGLLCFLVLLLLLFRLIRRRTMKTPGDDLSFALRSGAAGALVAAGIYSCFETPLEWPASASFLLIPVAILLLPLPGEEETDGAVRVRWPWIALASVAILAWVFPAAGMVRAIPSGVLGDRGHALFKEGRFSEAAEVLKASAEVWPCRPEVRQMEALAHYRNQETEKALKAAQASLELRPGSLTMLSMCGRCLKQLSRYEEAGEYFKKAMHGSRFEKTHQAMFELGKTYRLSGSPEAALNVFEYLHFKKPNSISSAVLSLEMAAALIQLKRDSELAGSLLRTASSELLGRKNLSELRKVPWLIKGLEMNFELSPHESQRLERLMERVEETLDTLDDS